MMLALNDLNDADGSMRRLIERMDRRIRHLLADGRRASAGDEVRAESIVKPRVDDLIKGLRRIYAEKQLAVACDTNPSLSVNCPAEDFDEIFGNILANAFKWAAGKIQIPAVRRGPSSRSAFVTMGQAYRIWVLRKLSCRAVVLTKPSPATGSV